MASQTQAEYIFHYKTFYIDKSQPLGHGSYGAVYKAKCDQLSCAAKVLHPTIVDANDPGTGKIMDRFLQECVFLKHIQHPNIVQYLNVTGDPESNLPVLLMELLDESLTKMLERSQQSLAYSIQIDISHDIALAVAYLHSNDIIHRDLSSNNVLIIAGRRAKVTDFGMSKLAGAASLLTMCPGTPVYMPPEALDEPPEYTKKLDCFSEGVIMIQVCTQLWPEPGPRIQTTSDSRSPTGAIKVPVLEVDRRKEHIDMIDRSHGLLPIALDCLHYRENERPTSEELCQRLAKLKETKEYKESVEKDRRLQNDIAELERRIGEVQLQLQGEILLQLNEILTKDMQIEELKKQLKGVNQQLGEQEQVTTEVQLSLQGQVEQLQRQLSQQAQQAKKFQMRKASTINQLHEEIFQQQNIIQEKEVQVEELKKQLQQSNQRLEQLQRQLSQQILQSQELQSREAAKVKRLQDEILLQQGEIQAKDVQVEKLKLELQQSSQSLSEQEQLTGEAQQAYHSLQRQVEQLQSQLSQQILQSQELQSREAAKIKELQDEILLQQGEIQAKDVQVEELKLELQQSSQSLGEQERLTGEAQQADHSLQSQVEQPQRQLSQQILQGQELQSREAAKIKQLQDEILLQQSEIQAKDVQVEELKLELQQSSQSLGEQEQLTGEAQQAYHSLQRQVKKLQSQLSQQTEQSETLSSHLPLQAERQHQQDNSTKEMQSQSSPLHVAHLQNSDPPKRQLMLGEWRDEGNAPFEMARGHAVVATNVAYFMNFDGKGCSYNSLTKLWSRLPECPNMYTGLVIIRGILTAIGGGKGLYHPDPENKLLSLKDRKWVKRFPAMPTKRYSAAAVTMEQHLIVAGGQTGMSSYVNVVEVMDTQTLVWSTVANLPPSTFWASAGICRDWLYVLGGCDKTDNTTSMLSCSVEKLLQSCSEASCDSLWQRIAEVPVHLSTCAAVDEDLVIVGGRSEKKEASAAVHKYNPIANSWDLISCMPTGRYDCLVALLPTHEMIVVGGYTPFIFVGGDTPPIFTITDRVEVATHLTYLT